MARKLYEKQAIRKRSGGLANGVAMKVYTNEAGTTLADISATLGGSAIAGSQVTTADIAGLGPASLRFYGPPDGTDTLYLRTPGDTSLGVQKIEADPDPRLDALESGSATGIPGTIFDVKGDLIAATAADTAARLAAGANDTVLTADSTTGTGLKWAAPAAQATAVFLLPAATGSDQTAAIQAVLDAAEAAGGGIVQGRSGTYRHDTLKRAGGVTIAGVGQDATIFKLLNSAAGDASFVNKTFVNHAGTETDWTPRESGGGYRDLQVDGNKANNSLKYGILERPVKFLTLQNIKVKSSELQGIKLHGTDLKVLDCTTLDTSNNGIEIMDSLRFEVRGNNVLDTGDFGIEIGAGYDFGITGAPAYCGDGIVEGNVVKACTNHGIALRGILDGTSNPNNRGVAYVSVTGNTVRGCGSGYALIEYVNDNHLGNNVGTGNSLPFYRQVTGAAEPLRNTIGGDNIWDDGSLRPRATVFSFRAPDNATLGLDFSMASSYVQPNANVPYIRPGGGSNENLFINPGANTGHIMLGIDNDAQVTVGSTTGKVGFFGATEAVKPTVTGSRGGNAALASLLTALATLGLITDSSSA